MPVGKPQDMQFLRLDIQSFIFAAGASILGRSHRRQQARRWPSVDEKRLTMGGCSSQVVDEKPWGLHCITVEQVCI